MYKFKLLTDTTWNFINCYSQTETNSEMSQVLQRITELSFYHHQIHHFCGFSLGGRDDTLIYVSIAHRVIYHRAHQTWGQYICCKTISTVRKPQPVALYLIKRQAIIHCLTGNVFMWSNLCLLVRLDKPSWR